MTTALYTRNSLLTLSGYVLIGLLVAGAYSAALINVIAPFWFKTAITTVSYGNNHIYDRNSPGYLILVFAPPAILAIIFIASLFDRPLLKPTFFALIFTVIAHFPSIENSNPRNYKSYLPTDAFDQLVTDGNTEAVLRYIRSLDLPSGHHDAYFEQAVAANQPQMAEQIADLGRSTVQNCAAYLSDIKLDVIDLPTLKYVLSKTPHPFDTKAEYQRACGNSFSTKFFRYIAQPSLYTYHIARKHPAPDPALINFLVERKIQVPSNKVEFMIDRLQRNIAEDMNRDRFNEAETRRTILKWIKQYK